MARFDADAYIEALEPPEIVLGGKTYKGRLLSLEEWAPFEPRLQSVGDDNVPIEDVKQLLRDYCYAVFPEPWWQLLNPWHKTVGELVVSSPPAVMLRITQYFFECQARALDVERVLEEAG